MKLIEISNEFIENFGKNRQQEEKPLTYEQIRYQTEKMREFEREYKERLKYGFCRY